MSVFMGSVQHVQHFLLLNCQKTAARASNPLAPDGILTKNRLRTHLRNAVCEAHKLLLDLNLEMHKNPKGIVTDPHRSFAACKSICTAQKTLCGSKKHQKTLQKSKKYVFFNKKQKKQKKDLTFHKSSAIIY